MNQEISIRQNDNIFHEILSIWSRRKWKILLSFLIPFVCVIGFATSMPNLYRANATVLVQRDMIPEDNIREFESEFDSRLQSINEVILSRSHLINLVRQFDLYPEIRKKESTEKVISRMRKDIQLERKVVESRWGQGATVGFTVSYQSWQPELAADVANTIAALYVEENEKRYRRQISSAPVSSTAEVIERLKRELAELRTRYSERYPDVIRVKAEIAALQRQLVLGRSEESATDGLTYNARATERGHDSETRINNSQLRIIEPALPPVTPVAPDRLRIALFGLFLAFAVAGGTAVLLEKADTSFHKLEKLWMFTNIPILAAIPRITTRADAWSNRLRYVFIALVAVFFLIILAWAAFSAGKYSNELVWLFAERGM